MVYFVPSTLGFIPESWKSDGTYSDKEWPGDAVLLTDDEASEFWKQVPPDGMELGCDDNGRPVWVVIPPPSHEQLVAMAEAEKKSRLDHAMRVTAMWRTELQLGIISDADKTQLTEWINYYKAVQAVHTETAPDIEWPEEPQPQ